MTVIDSMTVIRVTITGIFLVNILKDLLKYQNDHSDEFGEAILAQQGGLLTISVRK